MTHILFVGINKYDPKEYGGDISLTGCIKDIDKAEGFFPKGSMCRRLVDS